MTCEKLAQYLMETPNKQVMILDGYNGGGCPREINLGPSKRMITANNAEDCYDCENLVDEEVIVIGYGCY